MVWRWYPTLLSTGELETGELIAITVTELELKRVLRLVHRRHGTLSYAATAFLRTVRSQARKRPPLLLPG